MDPLKLVAEKLADDLVPVYLNSSPDQAALMIYEVLLMTRSGAIVNKAKDILESGDLPNAFIREDDVPTEPPIPLMREPTGDLPVAETDFSLIGSDVPFRKE